MDSAILDGVTLNIYDLVQFFLGLELSSVLSNSSILIFITNFISISDNQKGQGQNCIILWVLKEPNELRHFWLTKPYLIILSVSILLDINSKQKWHIKFFLTIKNDINLHHISVLTSYYIYYSVPKTFPLTCQTMFYNSLYIQTRYKHSISIKSKYQLQTTCSILVCESKVNF